MSRLTKKVSSKVGNMKYYNLNVPFLQNFPHMNPPQVSQKHSFIKKKLSWWEIGLENGQHTAGCY